MKYKAAGMALILLIATPWFLAQELSPLVVETLRSAVPTTVKSGEPFIQIYRLKFLDLRDQGKEVVVREEEIQTAKIFAGQFEVLGLEVNKNRDGQALVWDLVYTLRIIAPKKGVYKIPPLRFYWYLQEVGQDTQKQEAEVKYFETEEVPINYVTTTTPEVYLDVRDEIDFGALAIKSQTLKIAAWFLPVAVFLLWLIWFWRTPHSAQTEEEGGDSWELADYSLVNGRVVTTSRRQARRKLYHLIQQIKRETQLDWLEAEKGLLLALSDFLRAEIPALPRGYTPRETISYLTYLARDGGQQPFGRSKIKVLQALAEKAAVYQEEVAGPKTRLAERGQQEIRELKELLGRLRWYGRWRDCPENLGRWAKTLWKRLFNRRKP